ncbi:hypothetical protein H0H92_011739, partial [Tricholoma furcatifolium]
MLGNRYCLSALVAIGLLGTCNAVTIGPVGDLNIINKVIAPDGFVRGSTLAGDTFPGPVIVGNKGDRFQIDVINELTDPTMLRATTIVRVTGMAYSRMVLTGRMDLRWSLSALSFQTRPSSMILMFSTKLGPSGTTLTIYCDGLRGAFIIYDPDDPYKDEYDVDD